MSDLRPVSARGRADAPGRSSRASGRREGAERLRRACQQMEGLFLSQLMAHLSAPTWGGGILGRSAAHRIFARQRDVALAEQMGRRSELGLAKMLLRQLSEAQGAEPSPGRSEVAGWAEDMPEKGVEG